MRYSILLTAAFLLLRSPSQSDAASLSSKFTRETCPRGLGPYLRFNDTLPPFNYPLVSCPLQSAFTCCDREQDVRLQNLYIACMENSLSSGCCRTLLGLNCYSCDGIIALGGTKQGICADSLCSTIYSNCEHDYFTMDDGHHLIPCTEDSLVCTSLANMVNYIPHDLATKNTDNDNNEKIIIPSSTESKDSTLSTRSSVSTLPRTTLHQLCSFFGYPLSTTVPCYDIGEKLQVPEGYQTVNKTRKSTRPRSSSGFDTDTDNPYYRSFSSEPLTFKSILQQFQRLFQGQLREDDTVATLSVTVVLIALFIVWWKRIRSSSSSSSRTFINNYANNTEGYTFSSSSSSNNTLGTTTTYTGSSFFSSSSSVPLTTEQLREQRLQYFALSPKTDALNINTTTATETDIQYTSMEPSSSGTEVLG